MSRFKQHAEKLMADGQSIMDRYVKATADRDGAKAAYETLGRRNTPDSRNRPTYRELADAQGALETARAAYSETVETCRRDAAKLAQEGREGLHKAVDEFYAIDSEKYDAAFASLADAGIVGDADIVAAFDKYADNGTMLRYVAAKAEERRKAGDASEELVAALSRYDNNGSAEAVKANYETLLRTLDRFTCSQWSPYWAKQVQPMVEVF